MKLDDEYLLYILDQAQRWRPLSVKRMFGGVGFFHQGLFIAVIIEEVLYLKADNLNRGAFLAMGSTPFTYQVKGKDRSASLYTISEDIIEDQQEFSVILESAWQAALRAQAIKANKKSKS